MEDRVGLKDGECWVVLSTGGEVRLKTKRDVSIPDWDLFINNDLEERKKSTINDETGQEGG